MNIGFVAHKLNLSSGGSSFSLDLMAKGLLERGHSVQIFTTNMHDNNSISKQVPYEISDGWADGSNILSDIRGIYSIFEENADHIDIFHVFTPEYLPIAGKYKLDNDSNIVGRLNSYGVFCTNEGKMNGECHKECGLSEKIQHYSGDFQEKLGNLPKFIYQQYISDKYSKNIDVFFAISPQIKNIYSEYGFPSEKITVIPNFYDPKFDNQPINNTPSINNLDKTELLYVGRLEKEKGVDILLSAMTESHMDKFYLRIIGDGSLKNKLENYSNKLNIADQVEFVGWVDYNELPNYYAMSDIFVHPGRWPEPFGRTIIEAIQYECVPIVSDIGAPPWIIGDIGCTFRSEDPEALSKALKKKSKVINSGKTINYSEVLNRFCPESTIDKLEKEYFKLYDG
jgi:glycosyltransferase involved in cell wall biosynthesis